VSLVRQRRFAHPVTDPRIKRPNAGHLHASIRRVASTLAHSRFAVDDPMASLASMFRNPPLRLYLLGHAFILAGAWLMDLTGSMLPMALGASAALMLSMPLVKQLTARWRAAGRNTSER
jgi:hypothetical protein